MKLVEVEAVLVEVRALAAAGAAGSHRCARAGGAGCGGAGAGGAWRSVGSVEGLAGPGVRAAVLDALGGEA